MLGREAMKMLMNEACRASGLTRKAIEYYCAQGLLSPETGENGYRRFSAEDVQTLRKIATLRGLRFSVEEIRAALRRKDCAALAAVWNKQGAELEDAQARRALLGRLAKGEDWESVRQALDALDRKRTVLERMRDRFPGWFGRFVCAHFAPFLDEPVRTAEQRKAFETVIEYLDGVTLKLPEDLQAYLEETEDILDGDALNKINFALAQAAQNPEAYIEENRGIIEQYRAVTSSAEYQESPAGRLQTALKRLLAEAGYNDVFIPAMRRLSPKYAQYYTALQEANAAFVEALQ